MNPRCGACDLSAFNPATTALALVVVEFRRSSNSAPPVVNAAALARGRD
jgi:hypothetical protein